MPTFLHIYAAPQLAFVAAYSDATNSTTYTFTAASFDAPSATREIFVTIAAYQGGISRAISSVSIGGVAATLEATFVNGATQLLGLARASVPSGTTGDVVVTFSGGVANCNIAVYRVANRVNFGAGATGSGSTPDSGTSVAVPGIDVTAGGFVLSAATWFSTVSAVSVAGLSAAMDAFSTPEASGYSAHGSTPFQSSASTGNTITWSWTTSRAVLAAAWAFAG